MFFDVNTLRNNDQTYDHHFRQRVLEQIVAGVSKQEIAANFHLALRTVQGWKMRFDAYGEIGPSRHRTTSEVHGTVHVLHLHHALRKLEERPTEYYQEICDDITLLFGAIYTQDQMYLALKHAGITRTVVHLSFSLIYSNFSYLNSSATIRFLNTELVNNVKP